ncbi:hypothetical protein C8R41DRAFT_903230 [Lentinula lateritia]|uniref:Uncharacterized protein n=1 Tax=Lentinula lateritia TaxID=40482 RepID=A0ABQ8VHJ0_9AGAR|nr:hypothetical protein C8R41DRAFT_903230 [Lentinula lateritia]
MATSTVVTELGTEVPPETGAFNSAGPPGAHTNLDLMTTANMDLDDQRSEELKIASVTVPSLAQPLVLTGPGEVHMKPSPFQYHRNTPAAEWDEMLEDGTGDEPGPSSQGGVTGISSYADGHGAVRRRVRSMPDPHHGISGRGWVLMDVPEETEIYRKAYNAKIAAGTLLPSEAPTPEEYAKKLEKLNQEYIRLSTPNQSASKNHGARALSNIYGADLD